MLLALLSATQLCGSCSPVPAWLDLPQCCKAAACCCLTCCCPCLWAAGIFAALAATLYFRSKGIQPRCVPHEVYRNLQLADLQLQVKLQQRWVDTMAVHIRWQLCRHQQRTYNSCRQQMISRATQFWEHLYVAGSSKRAAQSQPLHILRAP
jgi:hypothetical protein